MTEVSMSQIVWKILASSELHSSEWIHVKTTLLLGTQISTGVVSY